MSDRSGQIGWARKWWIYQRERFPLAGHGPLIAAFSFCAVSFSHQLRRESGWPDWCAAGVAFATCFLFFLQLRIADEFKDYEEDLKYRPYRPVQRGLVTLWELGLIFACGAVIQFGLALWLEPRLVILLLVTWVYLAAMSKEFGIRQWLKARPLAYMVSHMMIMPLIDLYATGTEWLTGGEVRPPAGVGWFLMASLFNGMVVEIGRKIRSPEDEEHGVSTYSVEWGLRRAIGAWILVTGITAACAVMAARNIGVGMWVAVVLLTMYMLGIGLGIRQLRNPVKGSGKRMELFSGVWTIGMYLSMGVLPLVLGRNAGALP